MARVASFVLLLVSVAICAVSAQMPCAQLEGSFEAALAQARESPDPFAQRHLFKGEPPVNVSIGNSSVCELQCVNSDGGITTYFACCPSALQSIQGRQPTEADGAVLDTKQFTAFCFPAFFAPTRPAPPVTPTTQSTITATTATTAPPSTQSATTTTTATTATTAPPTTQASTPTTAAPDSCPSMTLSSVSRFLRQSRSKVCRYTCSFRVSVHGIPAGTRTRSYYSCCDGSEPTIASKALRLYRC